MENTTLENNSAPQENISSANLKLKKPLYIAIGVIVILILAYFLFFKERSVVATVDGSAISRSALIKKLEQKAGQEVLDAMIAEKLIENEAKKKGIVVEESEITGEFQVIESQITSMGSTLEAQLKEQGMTEQDLKDSLMMHLKMEKLLADKIQVTETGVDTYIKDNKITITKDTEVEMRKKIKEQIKEDKVNQFSQQLVSDLRGQAQVKYYVNY